MLWDNILVHSKDVSMLRYILFGLIESLMANIYAHEDRWDFCEQMRILGSDRIHQ